MRRPPRRLVDDVAHRRARCFGAAARLAARGGRKCGMTSFGEERRAGQGALVRHVADTAAADEDADAEIALDLAQPVAHRRGAADQDVAVALELLEAQLARRLHAGQQETAQGILAQVSRRREEVGRDLQPAAEQPQDVRARFASGRGVRGSHIDGHGETHLFGRGAIAEALRLLLILVQQAAGVGIRRKDADERIAPLGREADRLRAALRRQPDRRMRLLQRPRPDVGVAHAEMVAFERERTGLRPGAQDQVVRLVEALARVGGIDAERQVLAADAAHEAGDDAPAREHVEHRNLLGDAQRMVAQADGVAEDGELARASCGGPAPPPSGWATAWCRRRSGGAR